MSQQTELKLALWWEDVGALWGVQYRSTLTPRSSPTDIRRSAPAHDRQNAFSTDQEHLPSHNISTTRHERFTSPTRLAASVPVPASRLDLMLPPLRSNPPAYQSEPQRPTTIFHRRLSELLSDTPSTRTNAMATTDRPAIPHAGSAPKSTTDTVSTNRLTRDTSDEERGSKRRRLEDGRKLETPLYRHNATADASQQAYLDNNVPATGDMSGMAVLATAAAASR
jgi:hypothetical protein